VALDKWEHYPLVTPFFNLKGNLMQMSKFVRLTKGLVDKGILIKPEDVNKHIKDYSIDHYTSTYYYNENHFKTFQEKGSIKGIKDVFTNKIWWDFDSKDDLKLARKDAITLIERLKEKNIHSNGLEIFFSGNKGFNVILNISREINRKQVETIAMKFARDLKTFDTSLYDESQLLRVPLTKHPNSEYYKTEMTLEELKTLKFENLYTIAKNPELLGTRFLLKQNYQSELTDDLFEVEEVKKEFKTNAEAEFDLNNKPRGWKASKWALMQGFFKGGERDNSMMILAATCKAAGYDNITTYYMCKSALKKSWERYGEGSFSKEDLWNKIEQVYSSNWKGGQYSETEDLFLQKKSDELGIKELTTNNTVGIKGGLKVLRGYAQNIDKLTLKTGIEELDKRQRITVGMSWGIIAAPGVGKTSLALQMLHSMSLNGELCIYFSYDMYLPHVIQKIIQKHWSDNIEEVFDKYKNNDFEYVKKVEELITKEYPNVEFCAESGQTIEDIRDTIREVEQARGKKCKFVVIDYNELVITEVADPTQSSNKTAQNIRALASNEQICILSLFQPSKLTGDPSTEITSYRAAKGGSGIEQSVSLMFGVSRPGFNPREPENDKYVSMNCVKNRMGSVFSIDLHWDGYKGEVRTLSPIEHSKLKNLRQAIIDEKNGTSEKDNMSW
jgi:KaiC/GvpD/RAD55 family RecA-like ATPase